MRRLLFSSVVVAAFVAQSLGQGLLEDNNGGATPLWGLSTLIQGGSSTLCNKTFADANASGIFTVNPHVAQGPQPGQPDNHSGKTIDFGVAVTVDNPGFDSSNTSNVSSSYTLWFNTNGANFSNDYALGYDVCALVGLSLNYNAQLRGQNDNGSCLSTLDAPCISAIKSTVQQYATWLTTPSPGPNSNLTNTSLPSVCRTLSHLLVENFPKECSYFFQDKLDGLAWPLTSFGNSFQTGLTPSCSLNGTWQNTLSFYNNNSQAIYSAWIDSVTPVVAVWMPIADVGAQTTITEVAAELFCGHINHVNAGSYQPPSPPTPTPIAYNSTSNTTTNNSEGQHSGLSGGAIAGVVIGVLAGVAIAAGIALWLWRKKRRQFRPAPVEPMAEVSGEDARHELNGQDARAQLPATKDEGVVHIGSPLDRGTLQELEGKESQIPVELSAHNER